MKQCSRCKEVKDETEFYRDDRLKDNLFSECKLCYAKRGKEYYQKNKEKYKIHAKIKNNI